LSTCGEVIVECFAGAHPDTTGTGHDPSPHFSYFNMQGSS